MVDECRSEDIVKFYFVQKMRTRGPSPEIDCLKVKESISYPQVQLLILIDLPFHLDLTLKSVH